MPVLTPSGDLNASRADTFPVPLEPDIEHLRRSHGNATPTLCFTLIGQLQLPPSASPASLSSSLSLLSHFNCSLSDFDDGDDKVTWWLQQLALDHDPVYYALPVVLIAGIVCDALSAWLLARLLLRTPTRCQGDVTSDVYLLWLTVTSELWLLCAAARALPDYVTGHVIDSLRWTDGYLSAISEWLSYTCLWLLITMSLNAAVRLNAGVNNSSPLRSNHLDQNSENSLNHTHHHHDHHRRHLVDVVVVVLDDDDDDDVVLYSSCSSFSWSCSCSSCSSFCSCSRSCSSSFIFLLLLVLHNLYYRLCHLQKDIPYQPHRYRGYHLFPLSSYSLSTVHTIPIIIIITITITTTTISSSKVDIDVVSCSRVLRSTSSASSVLCLSSSPTSWSTASTPVPPTERRPCRSWTGTSSRPSSTPSYTTGTSYVSPYSCPFHCWSGSPAFSRPRCYESRELAARELR